MKLALFGGTFDPIHLGHIALAKAVSHQVDKVYFCPAAQSPFKEPPIASAACRFEMVQLAVEGEEKFEAIDIEIKRPGPSYTIDTLRELSGEGIKLFIILGQDVLEEVPSWKEGSEILKMATPLVSPRTPINSSEIRDKLKKLLDVSGDLDQKVLDYITKNHLYFTQ